MGPMTGRAAGYCTGYGVPGFMNSRPGFGRTGRLPGYGYLSYGVPVGGSRYGGRWNQGMPSYYGGGFGLPMGGSSRGRGRPGRGGGFARARVRPSGIGRGRRAMYRW